MGSFWDLFFLPRASGANFQEALDQIAAGMWIIIQRTYLASRALRKTTCPPNTEAFAPPPCQCLFKSVLFIKYSRRPSAAIHQKSHCSERHGRTASVSFILGLMNCVLHSGVQEKYTSCCKSPSTPVCVCVCVSFFLFNFTWKRAEKRFISSGCLYFFEAITFSCCLLVAPLYRLTACVTLSAPVLRNCMRCEPQVKMYAFFNNGIAGGRREELLPSRKTRLFVSLFFFFFFFAIRLLWHTTAPGLRCLTFGWLRWFVPWFHCRPWLDFVCVDATVLWLWELKKKALGEVRLKEA